MIIILRKILFLEIFDAIMKSVDISDTSYMNFFTESQKNILGISSKENEVLGSLKNSKSIFTLSKDTNIPRATLYPIVKNLSQRNFIEIKNYGTRKKYETISPKMLSDMIMKIGIEIGEKNDDELIVHKNENFTPVTPANVTEVEKPKNWFAKIFSHRTK